MEDNANPVIVRFEEDSEYSVSLETATWMMTVVGTPSMEALIHHSLIMLKDILEISYPNNFEISNSEHRSNVARRLPTGIKQRVLSGLVDDELGKKTWVGKEYTLAELMSDVTEENKHEHISFGHLVGREIL